MHRPKPIPYPSTPAVSRRRREWVEKRQDQKKWSEKREEEKKKEGREEEEDLKLDQISTGCRGVLVEGIACRVRDAGSMRAHKGVVCGMVVLELSKARAGRVDECARSRVLGWNTRLASVAKGVHAFAGSEEGIETGLVCGQSALWSLGLSRRLDVYLSRGRRRREGRGWGKSRGRLGSSSKGRASACKWVV